MAMTLVGLEMGSEEVELLGGASTDPLPLRRRKSGERGCPLLISSLTSEINFKNISSTYYCQKDSNYHRNLPDMSKLYASDNCGLLI